MNRFMQAAPALFACVLLTLLPACGVTREMRPGVMPPVSASYTCVTHRTPVVTSPEGIPRIERGAGEYCVPDCGGDAYILIFYAFIVVGYTIVWCCVELADLIYDACSSNEADALVEFYG